MDVPRRSKPIEIWTQPVNPLDRYHAALIAQNAVLRCSTSDGCKTTPARAHGPHDRLLVKPRSQFELIAELSYELANTEHRMNRVAAADAPE